MSQRSAPRTWRLISTGSTRDFRAAHVHEGVVSLLGNGAIHQRRADGTWAAPIALAGGSWIDMVPGGPQLFYGVARGSGDVQLWRPTGLITLGRLEGCADDGARLAIAGETLAAGCVGGGLAFWLRARDPFFERTAGVSPIALSLVAESDAVFLDAGGLRRLRRGMSKPATLAPAAAGHRLIWATRDNLVTASAGGEFHHAGWDSATGSVGTWATLQAPPVDGGVSLNAIWGLNADDLYAVGAGGLVLNFNGAAWRRVEVPTRATLRAMTGAFGDLWIAGDAGTLVGFVANG